MYAEGRGVFEDQAATVRWYRKAALQGNAEAQYKLGVIYAKGRGVPQESVEALKWFRMAAEQGDILAQYNLGAMYANGEGIPVNYILAYQWWDLASEKGDLRANEFKLIIAERMTPDQVAEARKLAAEWSARHESANERP